MAAVDFVGRCAAKPAMRAVPVVPIHVERQLALERHESIGNENELARALGLERSDAAFDDRQAPILPERPETKLNSCTPAPAPKSLRDKLLAMVRNEVAGPGSVPPEGIFEKSANRCRGW